jgi:hypothetical protein
MKIRIVGKKDQVSNSLAKMCNEVLSTYTNMKHRQIGVFSYLACSLKTNEVLGTRFPSLNHPKTRASRWAGK